MKKNKITIYFFIVALAFLGVYSCDTDGKEFDYVNFSGAEVGLETTSISVLDINYSAELSVKTDASTTIEGDVIELYKYKDDKKKEEEKIKLGEATVSGAKATFNTSILGTLSEGTIYLELRYKLSNGNTISRDKTISVTKAVSGVSVLESLIYDYPKEDSLKVKVSYKGSDVVGAFKVNWKKNKSGTYAEDTGFDASEKDTLSMKYKNLKEDNIYGLKVKDTLYYQFLATSKGNSAVVDTLELSIPFVSQTIPATSSAFIYSDILKNKLNLETAKTYKDTDVESDDIKFDIKFKSPSGFESTHDLIDFALLDVTSFTDTNFNTADKYFSEKDLIRIKTDYAAAAVSKLTVVETVVKDQLYVYKVLRAIKGDNPDTEAKEDVYNIEKYGLIKVGTIISVNSAVESIAVDFGEGQIKN